MPKRIARRLAGGLSRDSFFSRLAPDIKEGLRAIAESENASMSAIAEEVFIEFFHLKRPKYDPRFAAKKQEKLSDKVLNFKKRA